MKGDAAPPEAEAPPIRRARGRAWVWAGAAGVSLVAALGAVWLFRMPIAGAILRGQLAAQGVDSDFAIERLDFAGADIAALRLGAADLPDAAIARAQIRFAWNGLAPEISAIRLIEPRLRARIGEDGSVTLGSLDNLLKPGPPPRERPRIPAVALEIVDGAILLDTPFGALPVSFAAQGTLGRDFRAVAELAPTTRTVGDASLADAHARLDIVSDAGGLTATAQAQAARIARAGIAGEDLDIRATAQAPLDLARAEAHATWSLAAGAAPLVQIEALAGRADLAGDMASDRLAFARWAATAQTQIARVSAEGAHVDAALVDASLTGDAGSGVGRATLASAPTSEALRMRGVLAGEANVELTFAEQPSLVARGELRVDNAALTPRGRTDFRSAWPKLDGTPLGPLLTASGADIERALQRFSLHTPFLVALRGDRSALSLQPVTLTAQSGASLRLSRRDPTAPMFALRLADGALSGNALAELSGGGLPDASFRIDRLHGGGASPVEIVGVLSIPDWAEPDARLSAPALDARITLNGPQGNLRLTGEAHISGPAGAYAVEGLQAPVDLDFAWGEGFSVATQNNACVPLRFAALSGPGLEFADGAVNVCPHGGALFRASAREAISGGFTVAAVQLNGHIAEEPDQVARLSAGPIEGRFSGTSARMVLDVEAHAPRLAVAMPDREIAFAGARITAHTVSQNNTWRAEGVLDGGAYVDPALAANVERIALQWTALPEGEDAVIHFSDGQARLADRETSSRFNPLLLSGVTGALIDGRLTAQGALMLDALAPDNRRRPLGTFQAVHLLEPATGEAHLRVREMNFGPELQPYHLTQLARGVVSNVRGPVEADVDALWSPDAMTMSGRIKLTEVSLASATLPIIDNVSGEIVLDNLLTLSTPPGQRITVGELNPGVAVQNGDIRFQLLSGGVISLESAVWPFSGGTLSVAPRTLEIGADSTKFTLVLSDVDVAQLLATLNIPDLTATGRIEGEFPLVLSATSAQIVKGRLQAAPGGGAIAYTGEARRHAEGFAHIAFEALGGFRYDNLTLTLNGDLGGEIVSEVRFSGVNAVPVEFSEVSPVPTLGISGLPFRFHVSIRAPFRSLASTAATFSSGTSALDLVRQRDEAQERERLLQEEQERRERDPEPPPVDQPPPTPR